MPIKTFFMTLQRVEEIAPGVLHFAFMRDDGEPLEYIPGQFITLHIQTADKTYRRSYSIASIPGETNTIDFAASYVEGGIASELLFHLKQANQIRFN